MTDRQKQECLLTIGNVITNAESDAAENGGYKTEEQKEYIDELRVAHNELYKLLWGVK